MVQWLWKIVPENVNIELPNDPTVLLLGIRTSEMKTHNHAKACIQTFIAELSPKGGKQKQPK